MSSSQASQELATSSTGETKPPGNHQYITGIDCTMQGWVEEMGTTWPMVLYGVLAILLTTPPTSGLPSYYVRTRQPPCQVTQLFILLV